MSFTGMSERNNYGAEQRNYADYEHIGLSLRRLEEKLDVMMLTFQQMEPRLAEFECKMVSTFQQMEPRLAEFECKMVKLESACMKSNAEHNAHNSRQRCLKLQFNEKISSSVRTGDEIKGAGGNYLELALKDETGKLVDSGPESSAEVHMFALRGDVDENEGESGENGYLVDHTARERKKNKSILVGDVHLKLVKGSGILTNIKFKSSSSHMSGLFQIGARVVDHFGGIVVQDAKTDSFKVKDYRGKYNEKHRPPCLSDEIWRLDNIGKVSSIHDRLKEQDLNTVEDFLIQRLKDSALLKKLVDLPPKKWEATEKHALTCQLDEKVYCSINSEENKRVVFNAVGKVLGLIVESKYLPLDKLPLEAKVNATELDVAAFVHKSGLIRFDNEASLLQQFPGPVIASHPSNCTRSENTIDHEDEASEIGGSHPTNLDTSLKDDPLCHPIELEYLDQQFLDSLLADDNHQYSSFSDMLNESPIVSNIEVKKKLFFLFTVTKWLSYYDKFAAYDGNDNQKRRRIS